MTSPDAFVGVGAVASRIFPISAQEDFYQVEVMKAVKTFKNSHIAIVLLILLISTPAIVSAQNPVPSNRTSQEDDQDEVIQVETNLVTIPASVVDRGGRNIINLRKEDFQIFEDGIEQEVAFFAPVEQPFTILFLLDTSGSMTPYMADLARAANAFVSQLRPDDQLIAVSFSDSAWVNVLIEVTRIRELQKGIKLRSRTNDHDTMIYEAVDDALKRMKKVRGRKAIVLFSDGVGTGFTATAKGNLRDAEEQDTLIYTVQFGTFPAEAPRYVSKEAYFKRIEQINSYMRDLAQKTGGRYYQLQSILDLGKTFGLVADELRQQYSLGYYPKKRPEASQRRQIKVKVRLPNLVVRARDSYFIKSRKNK